MRSSEARRLCAELLVAAKGTPFEKKTEELFERLEG